jgi:hypothetical protein
MNGAIARTQTSANGPCWLQTLVSDFSPSPDLTTFNLAYGGATIDKDLAPSPADIISLEGPFVSGLMRRFSLLSLTVLLP